MFSGTDKAIDRAVYSDSSSRTRERVRHRVLSQLSIPWQENPRSFAKPENAKRLGGFRDGLSTYLLV
jgi:hypothetical protein